MRIFAAAATVLAATFAALQGPALADACAGLIGSNGSVQLGRTTTFAAYHDGVEHYVTAFNFQGGGGEFGALIPLPGEPTNVERGGDWTLQRLDKETVPKQLPSSGGVGPLTGGGAVVLQEVRIDALDLTVLSGGGDSVAVWAQEHGFRLSPDAPEVLDFYAQRSPIFLAAVFDGDAAADRGQQIGDGTPVHLTIPTSKPWVPLRILGLGKAAEEFVQADIYLLTDNEPAVLPKPNDPDGAGLFLQHNQQASDLLLSDLRSDAGMSWVPDSGWLTKLVLGTPTSELNYDLAIDPSGAGRPSRIDAGLTFVPAVNEDTVAELQPQPPAVLVTDSPTFPLDRDIFAAAPPPNVDPFVPRVDGLIEPDEDDGVPSALLWLDVMLVAGAAFVVLSLIPKRSGE